MRQDLIFRQNGRMKIKFICTIGTGNSQGVAQGEKRGILNFHNTFQGTRRRGETQVKPFGVNS
jgi:hypothetical protein